MNLEKMVNFCKQYGFIYPGSEIYNGLANTWDYGPLGSLLKNNFKQVWRKKFIQERENAYELDAGILMHPLVWKASGHVAGFSDPLIDCKECKSRHRVDNLINDFDNTVIPERMTFEEIEAFIDEFKVPCPKCQKTNFTKIREFNLMFETYRGVTKENQNKIYLRPENAQGQYVNYLNVLRSQRTKLPFGIGQIGKAFRNEITPGLFTFRTIEFEQMEFQTFCNPKEDEKLYNYFKDYGKSFYEELGISSENLRYKDHEKLAHYAKAACDIEYKFPFGWGEINGTHNRTDYDLKRHQEYSNTKFEYNDQVTNEKYIPYIIESTYGLDRSILAILFESYHEEILENGETREILKLTTSLAPYKVCVLPLIKKNHQQKAKEIYKTLRKVFMTTYDESGSIGKRYRRQDAIGTPYCITIDDDTLNKNLLTIRNRDTMEQETVLVEDLNDYLKKIIN